MINFRYLNYLIASVWVFNGLFCKVLNLVPRHQEIIAEITGSSYASLLTLMIGILEMLMAVWILSGISSRLNAITQIAIISLMNIIEFILVPELLLWGQFNAVFAFAFILVIIHNEYFPQLKFFHKA